MPGKCRCGTPMEEHVALQLGGPTEWWIHFSPPDDLGRVCHVVDGKDSRLIPGEPKPVKELAKR